MVSNEFFISTATKGSELILPNGSKIILNEVPPNALDIWESGSYAFCLRKPGLELLKDYPKEKLQKILELRRPIDYKAEIKLLEDAVKAFGKSKKPEQ